MDDEYECSNSNVKVPIRLYTEKRGFWPKASSLRINVTLRVFLGFFQDWKTEKLWPWGVRPSRQKFRQHLEHRNFWHLRIFRKFFLKKSIFRDFDVRFFQWRGCAWSKIFLWGDRHRLVVKPRGRPKSRTGPPRGVVNLFWQVISNKFMLKSQLVSSKTPFIIQYLNTNESKNRN